MTTDPTTTTEAISAAVEERWCELAASRLAQGALFADPDPPHGRRRPTTPTHRLLTRKD